ncbi:hypothetical protein CR205_15900 [Alteribacter lacisalsi]|uniref:DinB family protein n=1 Tax=Alteribacter lacisalsi TaxID=2045244 RepID=A0A2W0HEX6_9BACI|nr:hypothetical protein [Alteribacter lacisalsi]PYZ95865.1 hypothetical protein CR205_15900 [Alteribacter lacisalsi]
MEILKQRILKAMSLTSDFYEFLNEDTLSLKIPDVPSNTIGEQAYCIIGARESYLKALVKGEWAGFECSLNDHLDKTLIISSLETTRTQTEQFLQETPVSDMKLDLLIDLLEHEVQHHGQLIRYGYGNKIPFPDSWNRRYTV